MKDPNQLESRALDQERSEVLQQWDAVGYVVVHPLQPTLAPPQLSL